MPNSSLTTELLAQMRWMVPPLWAVRILLVVASMIVLFGQIETRFPVFNDEAIFADIIFRSRSGLGMNTPLFETFIPEVKHHSFWYPPLFFKVMSGWFTLVGEGIMEGRAGTIVISLLGLALLHWLLKPFLKLQWSSILVVGLLLADPYFQISATIFRMEMLTVFLGLISFLLYQLHFRPTLSRFADRAMLLSSGFFGGLSLLTHPLGGIFGATVGLAILLERTTWKNRALSLALYGCLPLLLVLWWILTFHQQFDIFLIQNQIQLHRKAFNSYYLLEVFKYQPIQRALLALYMLASVWATAIIVLRGRNITQIQLLYACFFVLGLIVPFLMKEMWYLLVFAFVGIIALLFLTEWGISQKKWWTLMLVPLAFVLQLLLFLDHQSTPRMFDTYESFGRAVSEHIPENSTVLLSSFPDPFFYLRVHRSDLDLRETPNTPPTEPIDPDIFDQIFSRADILVINHQLTSHQQQYMLDNTEEILFQSSSTDPNQFAIIKFKPVGERTSLDVPSHMQWQYPQLKN